MTEQAPARLRLDKWLWFARFVKSRTLAQELCESGHVTLNGASVHKASTTVKAGDTLTLVLGPYKRFITVVELGSRRGPAPEAQLLYQQTQDPERLIGFRGEWEDRPQGEGRPTKKDRRAIDQLKGWE
ncbi:heat shock protein Hsp15 [Insolitispirillum peregrinum]|uniref:Heat shock protein Hsp15 n=2 Tax=Insolitispirillum peregrinum TaxID=80876 RepID=A0A1N7JQL3_9PROT|nr:heat shock protein Hsp15 [Insolitispirillum peregrinum]